MQVRHYWERAVLLVSQISMRGRLSLSPAVRCAPGVRFRGWAIVDCRNGGEIAIGDSTVINSRNYGYHLNMFAPCKLMADVAGAKIIIGRNCRIHGSAIHAQDRITIGDNCLIAANAQIFDGNAHALSLNDPANRINTRGEAKPIVIGNSVWIGTGAIILPGTVIGDGAVIAANAVVRGVVPERTVFAGNPAVIVRQPDPSKSGSTHES